MIVRGEPDVSASARALRESIAQAAAWCGPRANVRKPLGCLRTPSLAPRPLEADRFAVGAVIRERQNALAGADGFGAVDLVR